MRRPPIVRPSIVIAALALALIAGACSSTPHSVAAPTAPTSPTSPTGASSSQCAQNRAAGTITYLTGFAYQADAGILDVIAAKHDGLYQALCLNVVIRSGTGDPGATSELVAAGRVTFGELGSPSDAMTVADNGVHVVSVATYGNVPAVTLLTMPSITNLTQLEGRTIGYKGAMPPQITAMLKATGVNVSKVHEIGVGYDPTILPRGQVSALTAYKSNEPVQLRDDGVHVTEWDPDHYGIKGSFNVIVANPSFAQAHPLAVKDFLLATFQAFDTCTRDPSPCIADAASLQPGYNSAQNLQEWTIQSSEITGSLLPGRGLGAESVAQWEPEASLLLADHLIKRPADIPALIDPSFVNAIERGRQLVTP